MTLVTDIPVWADCPFRDKIPPWIETVPDGSPAYEFDSQCIIAPEVAPSLKTQPNPADRKD